MSCSRLIVNLGKVWKRPAGGVVLLLLSFSSSGTLAAEVTNQQLRGENAEASSFHLRTSEMREKKDLALHPAPQNSSFEFLELNCGCNKNADRAMKWEAKAVAVAGEPLQKHQSLDLSSISFGACPNSKPVNAAERYFNSKGCITRTKSTPFELIQQRDTKELGIKENFSHLEPQPNSSCLEAACKAMPVSSGELNYTLLCDSGPQVPQAASAKQLHPSAFTARSHLSLVEGPYFPSLSPSSTGSKMSLDLPEKQERTVSPCSLFPTSPATLFPYYESRDSAATNPPTNAPPTLSQDTAIVGKLFLQVCVAF